MLGLLGCSEVTTPAAMVPAGDASPTGDGPLADTATAPEVPLVEGLAPTLPVQGVALFQSVRIPLAEEGEAPPRTAPVVVGRASLLRVYVAVPDGWSPQAVTAELRWERPDTDPLTLRESRMVSVTSREDLRDSVFTFRLAPELLTEGARYSVRLLTPGGEAPPEGEAHGARFPRDGTTAELGARTDRGGVSLVLVPIRYEADGSRRLPDTSEAQLTRIRSLVQALYPLRTFTVRVREPVAWTRGSTSGGDPDFIALNQLLVNVRRSDRAAPEEYYYGLVNSANTRREYRSSVNGLAYLVDNPRGGMLRVGSGVGFTGDGSANTLAHELGHMHGRRHAPCGPVQNADPSYPYRGGRTGVWGWDSRQSVLYAPDLTADFMGYCGVEWISDHNYRAIFERINAVRELAEEASGGGEPQPDQGGDADGDVLYRFLTLLPDAPPRWGELVRLPADIPGPRRRIQLLDASGRSLGDTTVSATELSEGAGVDLLIPSETQRVRAIGLDNFGTLRLP